MNHVYQVKQDETTYRAIGANAHEAIKKMVAQGLKGNTHKYRDLGIAWADEDETAHNEKRILKEAQHDNPTP